MSLELLIIWSFITNYPGGISPASSHYIIIAKYLIYI